jgi:hypothetical protein
VNELPEEESQVTPGSKFSQMRAEVARWLLEDAPQVLIIAMVAAAVVLLANFGLARSGGPSLSGSRIVSFDVVKLGNAERAVASGLLGTQSANSSDNALLLMQVSKRVQSVIHQQAHGAIVVVKQAVVDGNVPDITDSVLTELGLSTKVPDINPMRYLTSEVTTDLGFSTLAAKQQADLSANHAEIQAHRQATAAQGAAAMVP